MELEGRDRFIFFTFEGLQLQQMSGVSGINFLPIMNDNKSALRQKASKKGSIDPRLTTPHFDAISEQKNVRRCNKKADFE